MTGHAILPGVGVRSVEGRPFNTSIKHLVVAKAVRHYLQTKEELLMVSRAGVKRYILEWAKHTRWHPLNRVADIVSSEVNAKVRHTLRTTTYKSAKEAIEELEKVAASHCRRVVVRNPSMGRTLK